MPCTGYDVITWKRFPYCWSNVRTIGHRGSLNKGPVIQRYIYTRLIPFALFFLLTLVKRQQLAQ